MKKIFALFFGLFLAFSASTQVSKTGIAYLLPVENVVSKLDSNKKDMYPMYQRLKLMFVNPLTLLPENPQNPQSLLVYVKIKDQSAKDTLEKIFKHMISEPVVFDGTLFKDKKKKFLYRKGDVEVQEAFQVENWAPLSLAKERIAQMTGQVLADAKNLDSAQQIINYAIAENERLQKENEKLKADAQKEKVVQNDKRPGKENVPPPTPTKEQKRRSEIVIPAVKPSRS